MYSNTVWDTINRFIRISQYQQLQALVASVKYSLTTKDRSENNDSLDFQRTSLESKSTEKILKAF